VRDVTGTILIICCEDNGRWCTSDGKLATHSTDTIDTIDDARDLCVRHRLTCEVIEKTSKRYCSSGLWLRGVIRHEFYVSGVLITKWPPGFNKSFLREDLFRGTEQ
jgi:hypothetical protein